MTLPTLGRHMVIDAFLRMRGLFFFGFRHRCPLCGWRSRAFVAGGGSFRRRRAGYCPRCNSKARHRRVWMHLSGHAGLLRAGHRILVVAPHEATLRALRRCVGIHVTSVDVTARPGIDVRATANRLPFDSAVFDVVVSVHVLEHLDDDMTAIREMARVLSPTGRAIVNVPCDWNETTIEDATVTSPGERRRLFGEADHRRLYGRDLVDRLQAGGFATEVSLGDRVPHAEVERFGLSRAEHVFECRLTDVEARRR